MELFSGAHIKQDAAGNNKLQRLAIAKGYKTNYEFAKAIEAARIASYGAAYHKWNTGRIERTQYQTLKAIADFLGAETIEEVFDQ